MLRRIRLELQTIGIPAFGRTRLSFLHDRGQPLIVTAGCGWAQREGGPVEEIRPGDIVWFPPGEKHRHGATATTAMTHIAVVEKWGGTSAEWMEPITDEQFRK